MLRDACNKRGRNFTKVSEISGIGGTGAMRNKSRNSKLVEAYDQLQSENETLATSCCKRSFRFTEQRISQRDDNNRRAHLSMGGRQPGDREAMVQGSGFTQLEGGNECNQTERDVQHNENPPEQLHGSLRNERNGPARDRSMLLETDDIAYDTGDFRRSVHVTQCVSECEDDSAQGTTRQLQSRTQVCINKNTPYMPTSTFELDSADTTEFLFAWHIAAVEHGIEHRWSELSSLSLLTSGWNERQLTLLKFFQYKIAKVRLHTSDLFSYEYGKAWCAKSVNSCFCRELQYNKLCQLLCDVGDEYALHILLQSHALTHELVCLSLGSFQNNLDGMCRALAAKETIAILRKLGLLETVHVIAYLDNHNCTVVTVLVSRPELDSVQLGLMTQLDAGGHISHLYQSNQLMRQLFEDPKAFVHGDWRLLSAFAISVARCCDHSGHLLASRRICSIVAVPDAWADKGGFIVQSIQVAIARANFFTDALQLCANLLLEIDSDGSLEGPPVPCDLSVFVDTTSNFLDQLFHRAFGPRRVNDHHCCTKRWLVLVDHATRISIPSGSEHAFICCVLTSHPRLSIPYNIVRFAEVDNLFENRIRSLHCTQPAKLRESREYDIDRLFELLNAHMEYTESTNQSPPQQTGNWQMQQAPPAKRTCFMPFTMRL